MYIVDSLERTNPKDTYTVLHSSSKTWKVHTLLGNWNSLDLFWHRLCGHSVECWITHHDRVVIMSEVLEVAVCPVSTVIAADPHFILNLSS